MQDHTPDHDFPDLCVHCGASLYYPEGECTGPPNLATDLAERLRALDDEGLRAVLEEARIAAGWQGERLVPLGLIAMPKIQVLGTVQYDYLFKKAHAITVIQRGRYVKAKGGLYEDPAAARRAVEDAAIADGWRVPWRQP